MNLSYFIAIHNAFTSVIVKIIVVAPSIIDWRFFLAKPAVIEFANAECGCTQPEFNQAPVLKGKKGSIKVTYTAPNEGLFKKRVTVKYAGEKNVTELIIEGEVIK